MKMKSLCRIHPPTYLQKIPSMGFFVSALYMVVIATALSISCNPSHKDKSRNDNDKADLSKIYPASSVGINETLMLEALDYLKSQSKYDALHEAILIKDGKMIFKGDSTHKYHSVWSVTKSITSTLFGVLQDKNLLDTGRFVHKDLNYLTDLYPTLKYKHLMSLTSGYDAVGANNARDLERFGYGDSSPTPWLPAQPLFKPGTSFCYWDESINVLGHAISRASGKTLEKLFREEIAAKIGMDDSEWTWKYWANADGDTLNGGSGCCDTQLYISANQLARFGMLFLQKGKWGNNQTISPDWIEMATMQQVPANTELAPGPRQHIDARGAYGFNWWVNGITPSGEKLMPDAPDGIYFANGFNHNMLFVVPEWNLVFVRLGVDGNPDQKIQVYNNFFKLLSKSLKTNSHEN
jgi:CubicO group peptidase (beta-lactamase class C family)